MKEKSIIFSTEMVRAILEGKKTQTRRVIKPQPSGIRKSPFVKSGIEDIHGYEIKWPYQTGQKLWVKEALRIKYNFCPPHYITYIADCTPVVTKNPYSGINVRPYWNWNWKKDILPSTRMPRWASRITLEVVDVRVEKLQSIWDSTRKKEHRWMNVNDQDNPWVWVIEFKRSK